jgi:dTMP kinase
VRLQPGSMIVLEGLDRSGKTTQRTALEGLRWEGHAPTFTHMPSGLSPLTSKLYSLTEEEKFASALGRQLAHLTCHAENAALLSRARAGGLILDRWWWSTVAYGWYGGELRKSLSPAVFFGLIDAVWSNLAADVVLLFMTPFVDDDLNRGSVIEGYDALATEHSDLTVRVPTLPPNETTRFVLRTLRERSLLVD